MAVFVQNNNRFFPMRRMPHDSTATPWLAPVIGRSHAVNLYTINLLNSLFNLDLVSLRVHLEGIMSHHLRLMRPLFGHQWSFHYLVLIHLVCLYLLIGIARRSC